MIALELKRGQNANMNEDGNGGTKTGNKLKQRALKILKAGLDMQFHKILQGGEIKGEQKIN